MKKLLLLLVLAPALVWAQVVKKQDNKNNGQQSAEMSVRAKAFLENSTQTPEKASWSNIQYKELDLTKGANASLYYPEEPVEGQTNLFRLIINLMAENKLKAYEYLDGREVFSEKYELNVKDMLDKFHIIYEEKPGRAGKQNQQFVIDESDVPCSEVQSYYLKEKWVFDVQRSMFFPTVEAICPILHRSGDFGADVTKYPMFWIKYSDISPFLSQHYVMSDGMNNTLRYTFEDYFVMNRYEGEVFKTMNLRNRSLMQLYPDADSLKMAREKIQNNLDTFEKNLWVPTPEQVAAARAAAAPKDTVKVADQIVVQVEKGSIDEKTAAPAVTQQKATSRRSNPRVKKTKEEKEAEKAARKAEKEAAKSSAPVRSVRRRR